MMKDIRQSPQFARFMTGLGWKAQKAGKNYIYLKKFPLMGYFAKIPRPKLPVSWQAVEKLRNKYRIFKLKIAPHLTVIDKKYQLYKKDFIKRKFRIEQSPFNPVTSILIDLKRPQKEIFDSFTPAKRRAVRRAHKNNIAVIVTDDIDSFINIRKRQYFLLGILLPKEMRMLWKTFFPNHASFLLARTLDGKPIAGILLLNYKKTAYYWLASSLSEGKKLFAPTLLVWEALKLAKKKGCTVFDFEGIYDERFPKAGESWKGFTKFKEGFGGEKVVYMENFTT